MVLRRAEDMPRLVKQFWGRDLPRRGIGAWEPVEPGGDGGMDGMDGMDVVPKPTAR